MEETSDKKVLYPRDETRVPWFESRWPEWPWWQRVMFIMLCVMVPAMIVLLVLMMVALVRAAVVTVPPPSNITELNVPVTYPLIYNISLLDEAQGLIAELKSQHEHRNGNSKPEDPNSLQMYAFLKKWFPTVHNSKFIQHETIDDHSVLYKITASDELNNKLPYLIISYLPGSSTGQDNYIDSVGVNAEMSCLGTLGALEYMLGQKQRPQRPFYIVLTHNVKNVEGSSSSQSLKQIAELLRERGVNNLDFIIDGGYFDSKGLIISEITKPVAIVGVSDKGSVTLELTVDTGNTSNPDFPPRESAIGILSKAINKLEENKQPSMFGNGPEHFTYQYLSHMMNFDMRVMFANQWMFSPFLSSMMENNERLNSVIRTSTAVTTFNSINTDNTVSAIATAVVKHRVHPAQSVRDVIDFDKKTINDARVKIKVINSMEAQPISPFESSDVPYQLISTTISQTFKGTIVVPGVIVTTSDSRWFTNFTRHVYRFCPIIPDVQDIKHMPPNLIYYKAVDFYYRLFHNADLVIDYVPNKDV